MFFPQNCSWQDKVVSIDIPADKIMDSENVYGTSFPDSMIRKFSKNGKLKLNIAIDPINPVPSSMVPNKSSPKNTIAESKKLDSVCLCSINLKNPLEVSKWIQNPYIRTLDGCLTKGSMTSLTFLVLKIKSFKR